MIYLWRLEGQELVLNLKEILKYDELAAIYKRDKPADKMIAKRDFKFIDLIADRDSFCVREGLSLTEAITFAAKNSNMPSDFKPDKQIMKAIEKAKELNGGIIEDMLDSTISAFRVDAKLVKHIKVLMEDVGDNLKDLTDVEKVMKLTDIVINVSNTIPDKINKLLVLREEYNKKLNKTLNTQRGGKELTASFDGAGLEEFKDSGKVERVD